MHALTVKENLQEVKINWCSKTEKKYYFDKPRYLKTPYPCLFFLSRHSNVQPRQLPPLKKSPTKLPEPCKNCEWEHTTTTSSSFWFSDLLLRKSVYFNVCVTVRLSKRLLSCILNPGRSRRTTTTSSGNRTSLSVSYGYSTPPGCKCLRYNSCLSHALKTLKPHGTHVAVRSETYLLDGIHFRPVLKLKKLQNCDFGGQTNHINND